MFLSIPVIVFPWLILFLSVLFWGVNLPFMDGWEDYVQFLLSIHTKGFDWSLLWEDHQQIRIILPKLVLYFLSLFRQGPHAAMIFGTLIWLVNLLLVVRILQPRETNAYFLVLISAFFLSFAQREIFFWGFNIYYGLAILGFLLTLFGFQQRNGFIAWLGFLIAYLTTLGWLALIPLMIARPAHRGRSEISYFTLLLLVFLTGLYFLGWKSVSFLSTSGTFTDVWRFITAFLRILGNPYVMTGRHQFWLFHIIAMSLGLVYIVGTAFLLFQAASGKKTGVKGSLFEVRLWLIVLSLLLCGLTAYGRYKMGLGAMGMNGRYCAFVIFGWLALIVSFYENSVTGKWGRSVGLALLVAAIPCNVANLLVEIGFRHPKLVTVKKIVNRVYRTGQPSDRDLVVLNYIHDPSTMVAILRDLRRVKGWRADFLFE